MPSPSPASEFAIGIEAPYAEAAAPTEVVPRVVFSIEVVAPTEVTPEVASSVGTTSSWDATQITSLLMSLLPHLPVTTDAARVASSFAISLATSATSSLPQWNMQKLMRLPLTYSSILLMTF